MPHCTCGAYVSREFCRVFGNNDDEVEACFDCATGTAVKQGKSAGLDPSIVSRTPLN